MSKSSNKLTTDQLGRLIHDIRGRRVLLDADLAAIYGVTTAALNQAVKRNEVRFPADFCFQLSDGEIETLIPQNVISKPTRGGRTKPPRAFTEYRALQAANVLRSKRAVAMNTTCGDAVGWTALPVWETGERSGERESTSLSSEPSNYSPASQTAQEIPKQLSSRLLWSLAR